MKPIEIGGFSFKVTCPYTFTERTDLCAMINRTCEDIKMTLVDVNGVPFTQHHLEQTIIHEILHGIDYIYNNDSLGEAQVERLSMGLYQVLQKNNIYEIFNALAELSKKSVTSDATKE